jgi:hypothetical protein
MIAALVAVCGFIAWLFRINIKPMQTLIQNNTDALNTLTGTIKEQDEKIQDHEIRITEIETTHEILDCKNMKRRKTDK